MITVVSGLPRSGTSLVMQMLSAGGLPVLTDHVRRPDADNPRGYYEWEKAKLIPATPDCIGEAEGKAVKVVSALLLALPPRYACRVLLVRRPLPEVLASQAVMIRRQGTAGASAGDSAMLAALEAHLRQVDFLLARRPDMSVCRLDYQLLIRQPRVEAERMCEFLALPLDAGGMAAQVDPGLYRQRGNDQS